MTARASPAARNWQNLSKAPIADRAIMSRKGAAMETVHPEDGDPVTLRPCPSWCTLAEHFDRDYPVFPDDGYHHHGPEIPVPTSYRTFLDGPDSVVKVILKAWTSRLDGDPDRHASNCNSRPPTPTPTCSSNSPPTRHERSLQHYSRSQT